MPKMKKRILIYVGGVMVMAFGIALLAKSNLGNSPISSVPFVLSLITPFTFGTMTMAFHILCIVFQVVIWRKISLPIKLLDLFRLMFAKKSFIRKQAFNSCKRRKQCSNKI